MSKEALVENVAKTPSFTEALANALPCTDNSCCCIPERSAVIIIAIINFLGCLVDSMASEQCCSCDSRDLVESLRKLLVTLFQMANLLLLLASIFENALLVDIYVWYALAYIVMGFVVAIYEFARKTKRQGVRSLVTFIPEVVFLFVIFRCLPLVDMYRKRLNGVANISENLNKLEP